jgi:ribonuclease HII
MLRAAFTPDLLEAGCDEAGRGCLAGPVVAAAVILPKKYKHKALTDSKQLSYEARLEIRHDILRDAHAWAVAQADACEIDQINILNASFLAMHRAIAQLSKTPELLLIDGNRFHAHAYIPHTCIVQGDAKYLSIAAASILAKTYRDALMENLALQFPAYHWETNRGYPTPAHREAIRQFGVTPHHRKSFQLLPVQLDLFP